MVVLRPKAHLIELSPQRASLLQLDLSLRRCAPSTPETYVDAGVSPHRLLVNDL